VIYSKIIALVAIKRAAMSVFKEQEVYGIDYYVNGHCKPQRIGPDKRLAQMMLRERAGGWNGGTIWESFDGSTQMDG
jgi:hypothetical protein